jgi:FKBP-type peptidyl-prolyl cis-trans isomerase FkpA
MKNLNQKEWIAVIIGIFVVGFFFIFGQSLVTFFSQKGLVPVVSQPQVLTQDYEVGMGDIAVAGKRITVHYSGRFVDGTIFDSSYTRNEPLQFILGSRQVIQGLDGGIVGMRVGGKRIISIPPELGYGPTDYGPIPGNSTLIFEIELLKVE